MLISIFSGVHLYDPNPALFSIQSDILPYISIDTFINLDVWSWRPSGVELAA
jgi:hypothetical protein